jgi:nucleoside-diphosphate-sugar epimerase
MGDRSWDTTVWVADVRKIRAALGWEPRYDLRGGRQLFMDWMAARPELLRRYEGALEIRRAG